MGPRTNADMSTKRSVSVLHRDRIWICYPTAAHFIATANNCVFLITGNIYILSEVELKQGSRMRVMRYEVGFETRITHSLYIGLLADSFEWEEMERYICMWETFQRHCIHLEMAFEPTLDRTGQVQSSGKTIRINMLFSLFLQGLLTQLVN